MFFTHFIFQEKTAATTKTKRRIQRKRKSAIVISVNRTVENPRRLEVPRDQQHLYPPIKIDRKVTLTNIIKVPTPTGNALYKLVAAIEHKGSANSGHYVTWLSHNDEFFLANDDLPLQNSSETRDFDIECASLFLFRKYSE